MGKKLFYCNLTIRKNSKMKKVVCLLLLTYYFGLVNAQDQIDKKGWNFGYMPALAFNSDLGLLYGALINAYDYGDGSDYPLYKQNLNLSVSAYSRGSQDHFIEYESFSLIPGTRMKAVLRFVDNLAHQFYGFNGYSSVYNRDWEDPDSPEYISSVFYRHAKRVVFATLDIQDTIRQSALMWRLGADIRKYSCGSVDIAKLNSKKKGDELLLPEVEGLYDRYIDWGIIDQEEMEGGWANSLNFGLVYDTRHSMSNPGSGIYTELNLRWTPSFLGAGAYSHTKVSLIHRHYIPVIQNRITFAYRFIADILVSGDPAFFARPLVPAYKTFEGYGGKSSLRGIMKNRLVGESVILFNFELRSRIVRFNLLNQNWYLGINVFMDTGRLLKNLEINKDDIEAGQRNIFFDDSDKQFHSSYGAGAKMVMNENFVLSAEFAKAIDTRDGTIGIYIGLNYLF